MLLDGLRYTIIALLLLVIQFFFIQNINFSTWIQPMPYLYLLLILPFSMNRFLVLGIAFFMGFLLDSVGDTYGMHAASMVTLAFAKVNIDKRILDIDSIQLQGYNYLTPQYKGFRYYAVYTLLLIWLHHIVFSILNYFKFSAVLQIIGVSGLSTIFTFLFILLYATVAGRR
ncbi:MAG: rod shape-determining protein MreD [Bacteroidetes bacterium]|nr:rod shape-determining protein MreD [Bacteroidota bacterium]